MRTLVDASCLRGERPTGVTNAVRELLRVNAFNLEGTIELATYGWHPPSDAERTAAPYPWRHVRLPSKVMHALCGSGLLSFDRLFGGADRLFFPNLNIVGRPRRPYDLLIHDLSFLLHPPWFTRKTRTWHALARPRRLISEAQRLFVLSEWSRHDLIDLLGIPAQRITRLTLPVPRKTDRTPLPRPLAEPYFLLLSGADARKNALVARLAFQEFRLTHPNHRLVLAGMDEPVREAGVLSLGYLTDEERTRWLAHAKALLYPSWYEGFGLPPHEAAALGIPTIATGTGALAETAPAETVLLPSHVPHLWLHALERFA